MVTGARPLEEVDQVDWGVLEGTSEMFRALVADDDEARAEAYEHFYSQVAPSSSAATAVPFLIGLVAEKATPQRAHLLELINALAGEDTEAAVKAGASTYVSLLDDADADVRLYASQLVTQWPEPKDAAAAGLRARAEKDDDERVRANALLGLRAIGAPDLALAEAKFSGGQPLEKLAAAMTLVGEKKAEAPAALFEYLAPLATTGAADVEGADGLPGLGDPWASLSAAMRHGPSALREQVASALQDALDSRPVASEDQLVGLLICALGGKLTAEALATIAPWQKEAVRAVANKSSGPQGLMPAVLKLLGEFGLPSNPDGLKAFLSEGEPSKPWWKVW